ncbi:MAG: bifunctional diaminohydroxyphosphoribosylaminopyrimidine deaminase/5-amino-6-(5-phosphoribosylamino)uracil reductase RibD [Bacteroidia bacterium]|nr:bifunctional diaminohydroxyphosphoribosylaminopyrimidine deaminase/5-amino-6-(5-phosphoribosylamino)uracil reductase RibD [Bacteroidia bacterium]
MQHQHYMQRALQLAAQAKGNVAPNPMVGCVIVYNDVIIAEDYHRNYGQAHAEVNAINKIKEKNILAQCTVYVSLEPCAHFGKTPPCANLLIQHNVKHVVVATLDPNPLVAGKGVAMLRKAGITVEVGVLENEAKQLNKRFFVNQTTQLPFIVLKYAQSQNGYIAAITTNGKQPVAITNAHTNQLMHQLRATEQAIMVGYNTVLIDNPSLTTRLIAGKNPTRIVIDYDSSLPLTSFFFDNNAKVIVINRLKTKVVQHINYLQIKKEDSLQSIFKLLYLQNISSIIIEGGTQLLQRCIDDNLWHEAIVITSNVVINNGYSAPVFNRKKCTRITKVLNDTIAYYNSNL